MRQGRVRQGRGCGGGERVVGPIAAGQSMAGPNAVDQSLAGLRMRRGRGRRVGNVVHAVAIRDPQRARCVVLAHIIAGENGLTVAMRRSRRPDHIRNGVVVPQPELDRLEPALRFDQLLGNACSVRLPARSEKDPRGSRRVFVNVRRIFRFVRFRQMSPPATTWGRLSNLRGAMVR